MQQVVASCVFAFYLRMFQLLKVAGDSLLPEYQSGDFVVILKISGCIRLRVGDVIVFRQPGYGILIKRIQAISPDGQEITAIGANPASVDSRIFGVVRLRDVLGKVVWQIRKPG